MAIFVGKMRIFRRINIFNALYRRTYSSSISNGKTGLVLGAYTSDDDKDVHLTPASEAFNAKCNGKLLENMKLVNEGLTLGKGQLFHNLDKDFPVVAVVGLGRKGVGYNEQEGIHEERENVRIAASVGSRLLRDVGMNKVFLEGFSHQESAAEGATLGLWQYEAFKNKAKQKKVPEIELYGEKKHGWKAGVIKAEAQNLARKLMDSPANRKTPTLFSQIVSDALNAKPGVEMFVRDKSWIEDQKMTSFLSVARGSSEPPVFLEIHYKQGSKQQKPIALVGKGVTFDSGGLSLKNALHMDVMRADCGGASCVVGAIYAAASLKLPINVVGLIPLTENMPDGAANKPGDVVYAKNGKSITIIDTDFEGRLILCDALCYAQEFDPRITINLATLTMEAIYALGHSASAAYSNSSSLFEEMHQAGSLSGDRVWRMPLWNYFSQQVNDSQYSDFVNLTGPGSGTPGGSCAAAAFLKEFVPKGDWMHLDIASVMGPSDTSPYLSKGMTGRPTRTLVEFLIKQSKE